MPHWWLHIFTFVIDTLGAYGTTTSQTLRKIGRLLKKKTGNKEDNTTKEEKKKETKRGKKKEKKKEVPSIELANFDLIVWWFHPLRYSGMN